MKSLLFAAALALAVPALPLLAVTASAKSMLPATDETAAATARDTFAGGTWTGAATIDKVAYQLIYTLSASGRGAFKATDPGGKVVEFSTLWGVVNADAAGAVTLIVAFLEVGDKGGIEYDEEPMIVEGSFTPTGTFAGTMKFEGEAAVELTRQ